MKNIGILTGGDSEEYDISLRSAETVLKNLNKKKYTGYIIHLKNNEFTVLTKDNYLKINEKDFSFIKNNKKIKIDQVFMALHGPPAENGEIQSYFEKLNISYTSCNSNISKLTFNKYDCNKKLQELGFLCPKSILYNKNRNILKNNFFKKIHLPYFVKPTESGSSYGVSKVLKKEDVLKSINYALKFHDEVMIEEYIEGRELSVGVYLSQNGISTLPVTEIISENEFFDYEAKYFGKSKEITPASLTLKIKEEIQKQTIEIYKKMNLKGVCRIDYILKSKNLYIIEINTIPGLSKESIIPQQINAAKLSLEEIFDLCLVKHQ